MTRQALQGGDVLLVRGRLRELIRSRDSAKLELNVEFKLRDETLQTEDLRLVQALHVQARESCRYFLRRSC